MATVREYMATRLVTFTPETDIHKAIKVLLKRHLSGAPVLDERGALVGMLSKKDCLEIAFRAGYHQDRGGHVRDYMHEGVESVSPDLDIVEAAELFLKRSYRRFPVVENGEVVGMIARHDVLRALERLW